MSIASSRSKVSPFETRVAPDAAEHAADGASHDQAGLEGADEQIAVAEEDVGARLDESSGIRPGGPPREVRARPGESQTGTGSGASSAAPTASEAGRGTEFAGSRARSSARTRSTSSGITRGAASSALTSHEGSSTWSRSAREPQRVHVPGRLDRQHRHPRPVHHDAGPLRPLAVHDPLDSGREGGAGLQRRRRHVFPVAAPGRQHPFEDLDRREPVASGTRVRRTCCRHTR